MQIQKHEAPMAIEIRIDTACTSCIESSTELRPQKGGMTVPETEKTLLQTNSAPEVLERITITAMHQS
jgi:hypothetical protein